MAIAILIRGLDLFRLFDIVWALTQGGPGTMTETISIYTYVQGFQQFETSYTAAIAFLIIVLLSVVVMLGAEARGDRAMSRLDRGPAPDWRCATPPRSRSRCRLPVPDLLAVHRSRSRRRRRSSPFRRSGVRSSIQFDNYAVLFKDGDAITVWNSLVIAGVSTVIAMVLGTICAY